MLAKHPACPSSSLTVRLKTEVSSLLVNAYAQIPPEPGDPVFSSSFYAPYEAAAAGVLALLCDARSRMPLDVLSVGYRLKSSVSIRGKLRRKGLPETVAAARSALRDVAGLRVVLASREAVYRFAELIISYPAIELEDIHDYIAFPKPSGYRSLHLIMRMSVGTSPYRIPAEIQLRTAAMDAWACAEHALIYKPLSQLR